MQSFFLGRQPIFDRELNAVAYELLFRGAASAGQANVVDGDQATSQVILNAFLDMDLDQVVDQGLAFVNFTRAFLTSEEDLPFPVGRVVVEVLEDIEPDAEVIAGIQRLKAAGHIIALDDFIFHEKLRPLVELAQIIKIDLMAIDRASLIQHVETLRPYRVKLLAEKIETHEEFEFCKELGFDYFQGYFLSKPKVIEGQRIPASRLATLRLLAELQNPEALPDDIARTVSEDVSLSYRLLRMVNSAMFALPRQVDTIRQAVVYLGNKAIKNWASLLVTAGIDDKPAELIRTALVRARSCERLAELKGYKNSEQFFTVGLFSVLDALMDVPLAEILNKLPLSAEIIEALLQGEGPAGAALAGIAAYERWDWESIESGNIAPGLISQAFVEAMQWASEIEHTLRAA